MAIRTAQNATVARSAVCEDFGPGTQGGVKKPHHILATSSQTETPGAYLLPRIFEHNLRSKPQADLVLLVYRYRSLGVDALGQFIVRRQRLPQLRLRTQERGQASSTVR